MRRDTERSAKPNASWGGDPVGVRLIAAGMLLWGFGYGLHTFLLPVHLRNIGCSPAQVGLVFSVGIAAMALSALPGGWIADRYDRRKVMFLTWLAGAPSALLYYFARDYRLAALGMALYLGAQVGYPALNAYITESVSQGAAGSTFGLVNAAFGAGMVVSPMLGGWIAERWGAGPVFITSFLLFLAAAGIMAFLPPAQKAGAAAGEVAGSGAGTGTRDGAGVAAGYVSLLRDARYVRFIVFYSACAFGYYMVQPLFSQFVADVRGAGAASVGLLGTLMSLGQVAITAVVGKVADRRGAIIAVAANMVLYVAAMIVFVFVSSAAVEVVTMFMLGGFMAGQGVAYAGVGEVLGPRTDGKAFALFMLAIAGVSAASPYVGGSLYAAEPGAAFVAASALTLVFAGLLMRLGITVRSGRGRGGEAGQEAFSVTGK